MYSDNSDPLAEAFGQALENGDYETALALQVGLNQGVAQAVAQQAYAEGHAAGQAAGQPQQPPPDEGKVQEAYRGFLESREALDQPKSPAQKIVDAHHADSYESKVRKGLFKGLVPEWPERS
jgi:hypothetical protein